MLTNFASYLVFLVIPCTNNDIPYSKSNVHEIYFNDLKIFLQMKSLQLIIERGFIFHFILTSFSVIENL